MLLREARIMLKSCHSPLRSFLAEVKSYGMFSNVICDLLCLFVLFSALFVYFFSGLRLLISLLCERHILLRQVRRLCAGTPEKGLWAVKKTILSNNGDLEIKKKLAYFVLGDCLSLNLDLVSLFSYACWNAFEDNIITGIME